MIGPMIGPSSQCSQLMLTIDIGPMIDQGLDDNCEPILACYIGPKIAPDYRPRVIAKVDRRPYKFIVISIMTIKFKNLRIIAKTKKKKVFCHIVRSCTGRDLNPGP